MLLSEHVYYVAVTFKIAERVEPRIYIKFCVKLEHSSMETVQMIQKAAAMGKWLLPSEGHSDWLLLMTTHPLMHRVSCRVFLWNIESPRWLSPLQPRFGTCDFWLFPKLKSPLKGKRFQTINEIQENSTGQRMRIGRNAWRPKVPTLKWTEGSLSCVQCFLYVVSSSLNVSSFHITWLDAFWTDLVYVCTHI